MSPLRIKADECKYKDRRLKELFIIGINNDEMMTEIIQELLQLRKQLKSAVSRY